MLFLGELKQVRCYLLDPAIKAEADDRAEKVIAQGAKVVIGHSLGSVVAFEFVRQHPDYPVDLLLTLGSPLGLRTVRALMPDPAYGDDRMPLNIARWVSLRDPRDPVACAGQLNRFWPGISDDAPWTTRVMPTGLPLPEQAADRPASAADAARPRRRGAAMTADPIDANILRRNFVAIATSTYEDPSLPYLPVLDEVRTLADWFWGAELGNRQFTHQYPDLANNPTEDQIRHALKNPDASLKWRPSDAAVLFITGHGLVVDGTLWLALRQTRTDAIKATALKTADIVGWLTNTGIEHLLLVLDTCYAGQVAGDIVEFDEELPRTWLVLASTAKNEEAIPGALTGAIQQLLDELGGPTGENYGWCEDFLPVGPFLDAIDEKLGGSQRVVPVQGSQLSGKHVCLPNPKYQPDPFVPTARPRRDLALLKRDMKAHWVPRSRGATGGWLFTGRAGLWPGSLPPRPASPAPCS